MELIFADDAGKDETRNNYLVEGAVALNEDKLTALDSHVGAVKRKYGIDDRYELHWTYRTYKPRQSSQRTFPSRALTVDAHRGLRRDVLDFLTDSGATIMIRAHAHGRGSLVLKVGRCLTFIAERAQMHLQDTARVRGQRVFGLLIADEPGSNAENAELAEMLRLLHRNGSDWIERFDTLVMNSFVYPSDLVSGIQLADFVAGAADRALNRGEQEWWLRLAPHVRHARNNPQKVLGYGLKVWPTPARPFNLGETRVQ